MISMIAAMAKNNRVIGKDNKLPWHFPEDLRYFKKMTIWKTIVLGRKSHDSIASLLGTKWPFLPQRHSVVLSKSINKLPVSSQPHTTGEVVHSIDNIVSSYQQQGELMVIGGAQVYELFLPYTKRIYLTEIHEHYDGDVFFPVFESDFHEVSRVPWPFFDFVVYERN